MILQKALRDSGRQMEGLWPRYAAAIHLLKQIIVGYRLGRGIAFEQLTEVIRGLRAKLWWRRPKIASATAVCAFLIVGTTLVVAIRAPRPCLHRPGDRFSRDQISERAISRAAQSVQDAPADDADILRRWEQRKAAELGRDFANLENFQGEHASEADAKARLEKDAAYLALWGGGPHAAEVAAWKASDGEAAKDYETRLAQDTRYQGMLTEVSTFAKANKFTEAKEKDHFVLSGARAAISTSKSKVTAAHGGTTGLRQAIRTTVSSLAG